MASVDGDVRAAVADALQQATPSPVDLIIPRRGHRIRTPRRLVGLDWEHLIQIKCSQLAPDGWKGLHGEDPKFL